MRSFRRALRYCRPYRYRIAAAWLCALLIAGLYLASLSSTLPLFRLLFSQSGISVDTRSETVEQADGSSVALTRYSVTIPVGYRTASIPPDQALRIDQEQKIVYVPEGYEVVPGGLER
ncbi:MAG: hypothetical protein GWP05_07010, partial [Anaerolineaceae bacterium]|nr:hypothetical protein [Anaerolineaceae bacterium]